jgi:hypothetical protein
LKPAEKQSALVAANNARCVQLRHDAGAVRPTDSTCPVRENNIERIKTMVRDATKP